MSQQDLTLSCAVTGTTFTTNISNALAAVNSIQSGDSAPTDNLEDGVMWLNTTGADNIINVRIGSSWIELARLVSGSWQVAALSGLTSSVAELNLLDGVSGLVKADFTKLAAVSASATELNTMDGITSSTAELNLLDDVAGLVQADFTKLAAVTASASELNIMDGVTASTTEINLIDGVTRTTAQINSARDGTVTSVSGNDGLTGTVTGTGNIGINDSGVTTVKINDNAVTLAKMDGIARGSIIVGDSGGSPSVINGSTDQLLTTNSSGDAVWATVAGGVEAGTVMVFYQAAAPTGWTQVTGQNDKALRVVSGNGGGSAGTTPLSSNQNQTPSVGGTTGPTTLTADQMPRHSHSLNRTPEGGGGSGFQFSNQAGNAATTGETGGGNSHTHTQSGSVSITINAPQYIDVIIASKN